MADSTSSLDVPVAGSTYDETPYPSSSFPQTHPEKLCAMGRLFGLNAPAPSSARVLELGCADGANLLPMAQHAPGARFLGIDASAKQVAAAHEAIKAAGLSNVEIRHQNLLEFPATEGKFDYILVHGIFSWVPDNVRDKILQIASAHLSENGVAYISYNAFPGWGMRMALRDMMLFHTRPFKDPKTKVQQARALAAFLAESVPVENNPYGLLLKKELEQMKGYDDNYLRHDLLEEINQPFYFHEFIARAARARLQYLGEPMLQQMLASNFPDKVRDTLKKVGPNIVGQEQYMDFVRNRNFRQTLVCRSGVKLTRHIAPETLKQFHFASSLEKPAPEAFDPKPGVPQKYTVRGSTITLTADSAFLKAMFNALAELGVSRVSFADLLQKARAASATFPFEGDPARRPALEEASVLQNLMHLYTRGVVDIFAEPLALTTVLAEKPSATPLARYQARHSRVVTNRAHSSLKLDVLVRFVLSACDGTRDAAAVVEHLVTLAQQGELKLSENGQPLEDAARVREVLENRVSLVLPRLAAGGFFA